MRFLVVALSLSLALTSCQTISYYGQAAAGQLYILSHRQNIEALIQDEETRPELKHKLNSILSIRSFAEESLALPVANNYSTYVDLKRPYVVWNVFATPTFSMQPTNWCYPIAGCVSYRGYFSENKALSFANQLDSNEYDVYVAGVAAYSTLGWFSDSILNTVVTRDDYRLASLIFHELAHQVLYIPGDTNFNESFATAVERAGLERWLNATQRSKEQKLIVELNRQRQSDFVALVSETVGELTRLYSAELDQAEMEAGKQRILSDLKRSYIVLKENWGGYAGYDDWFSGELNNAKLSTVATYFSWVPAFEAMLADEDNDLKAFYARAQQLESFSESERTERLEALMPK